MFTIKWHTQTLGSSMNQDLQRLQNLYTSQPENEEQTLLKAQLIEELEYKLGIRIKESSALVVNGDLDDVEGFRKR